MTLDRFIEAQRRDYDLALSELRQGRKRSHWIWYIFPQLAGLGRSSTSVFYGIQGFDEARAYLSHPILGPRLEACAQALLDLDGEPDITDVMGYPDDLKLRSSMTLFAEIAGDDSVFAQVLARYYDGQKDPRTLVLLAAD